MKFDKFGYWIMNDVIKPIADSQKEGSETDDEPDAVLFTDDE